MGSWPKRTYNLQSRQEMRLADCNAARLSNGACVRLGGVLEDSPGAGQDKELQVQTVDVLGACDPEVYCLILYHG